MDPISLILQALEAGTSPDVGYQAMIPDEILDRYGSFTDLLGQKFSDSATGQAILEQYAAQPDVYEGVLVELLEENGLDTDEEVLNAARDVLELTDVRGATRGEYTVNFDDEELDDLMQGQEELDEEEG
jgi:hypothetical protein